jgi:hypothetical protein
LISRGLAHEYDASADRVVASPPGGAAGRLAQVDRRRSTYDGGDPRPERPFQLEANCARRRQRPTEH